MSNSSLTGGFLTPDDPQPLDDVSLDALLQQLVTGITGIPGVLVRPRWQAIVPKMPEPQINWCAFGVVSSDPDDGPWISYDPLHDVGPYVRHETLITMASFYGPNSRQIAGILRDGLTIPQNTDTLRAHDMAWVDTGAIRQAPELYNNQWIKRQDMTITFRRKITRSYKISYIAIVGVVLEDDTVINETFAVPPDSQLKP